MALISEVTNYSKKTGYQARSTKHKPQLMAMLSFLTNYCTCLLPFSQTYNQSQSSKRSLDRHIVDSKNNLRMYLNTTRMLPDGVNPVLHKMHITCGQFDHSDKSRQSIRGRRSHFEGRDSLIIHPQNLGRCW